MELFREFSPVTNDEWRKQIERDLKGEPFDALLKQNENCFQIKPFYTAEQLKQPYDPAFTHTDWYTCVKGTGSDEAVNNRLLSLLKHGASAISVDLTKGSFEKQLKHIDLRMIRSTFHSDASTALPFLNWLTKNYKEDRVNSALFLSPRDKPSFNNWLKFLEANHGDLSVNGIETFCADVLLYHNSNCTASYELALAFAQLIEFLNTDLKNTGANVVIRMGVDVDYFVQIAKFRAVHRLWRLLSAEYGTQATLHLMAETSLADKSATSATNNLLRSSYECMAAVLGGCHEVLVNDYDVFSTKKDTNAARLALNQQFILKEEVYLDQMADVGCHSFYIESLTDALAEKALSYLKDIEQQGGFFAGIESGSVEAEIRQQSEERKARLLSGKQTVVGVTKYVPATVADELKRVDENVARDLSVKNHVLTYELEKLTKNEKA
jgi:methylmalonyl-CoA mutase